MDAPTKGGGLEEEVCFPTSPPFSPRLNQSRKPNCIRVASCRTVSTL